VLGRDRAGLVVEAVPGVTIARNLNSLYI